jgi:heparosan-N-sulfate-glucuronate 5-epimerase
MTAASTATDFVKRGFAGALSRGYGYEPMFPGEFYERDRVVGYYIDYSSKTTTTEHPFPELTPANLAQLVLGWHERHLREQADLRVAIDAGRYLLECAEPHGSSLLWPYHMEVPKYGVRPPWYSGFAQSQIASGLLRLWLATGDDAFASAARSAIAPILAADDPRFVTHTRDGPILEEGPGSPPSHVLNGWIFSLFGLRDVAIALSEPRARELAEASTRCLLARLRDYDVGWWTRYSLFPHTMPDLAKPIYHRLHVDLMSVMHDLTGAPEFGAAAARWRSYDGPVRRSLAVLSKLPFVALEARRRRRMQPTA